MTDAKDLLLAGATVAVFASIPLVIRSEYLLNLLVMFFLYVIVAQSWNLLGGFTGQISLGHSAFFGVGALATRSLWVGQVPILLAVVGGGFSSALVAAIIGVPCLRMRSAYFPIGTLALAMIAQTTIANIFPVPGSLSREFISGYNLPSRYYLALSVAIATILVVYVVTRARIGLALVAIRDDEGAAEAMGVRTFRHKVFALLVSTSFAGLGGGIFAYHQVSYYYDAPFDLSWAFLPTLATFIGGVGTIPGPIVGSLCFLALSELFASFREIHILIFSFTFILIVLFLPDGLMSISRLTHTRSPVLAYLRRAPRG
jgi:branched-chain amino acid transport system permease protein